MPTNDTRQQGPIEAKYVRRLDSHPMTLGRKDRRYPRGVAARIGRGLLRVGLLPVQFYAVAVAVSAAILAVTVLAPGVFTEYLSLVRRDAGASQVPMLSPVATEVLRYPWSLAVAAGVLVALVRLDLWGRADRRRERGTLEPAAHSQATHTQSLRLYGDAPYEEDPRNVQKGQADPLGFRDSVDVLCRLILNSAESAPLAISIEAEWGMGKTTAMRMIEARLRNRVFDHGRQRWRCLTVYFNPWKYTGSDVREGLMSAVFGAIPPRALRWYLHHSHGMLVQLALDIAGQATPLGDVGSQVARRIDRAARYRNEFEHDLRDIMKYWEHSERKKKPLLVIFVDDLDRCTSTEVARTFETIKLFFDVPGCVFVLGFDPVKVAAAIQLEYRGISDGSEYLKKIIQLNYRLPPPAPSAIKGFLERAIADVGLGNFFQTEGQPGLFNLAGPGGHLDLIANGTGGNPREMKRLLNAVAVSTEVVAYKDLLQRDVDRVALCLLMLLQVHRPAVYLRLLERMYAARGNLPEDEKPHALAMVLDEVYESLGLGRLGSSADQEPDAPEGGTA